MGGIEASCPLASEVPRGRHAGAKQARRLAPVLERRRCIDEREMTCVERNAVHREPAHVGDDAVCHPRERGDMVEHRRAIEIVRGQDARVGISRVPILFFETAREEKEGAVAVEIGDAKPRLFDPVERGVEAVRIVDDLERGRASQRRIDGRQSQQAGLPVRIGGEEGTRDRRFFGGCERAAGCDQPIDLGSVAFEHERARAAREKTRPDLRRADGIGPLGKLPRESPRRFDAVESDKEAAFADMLGLGFRRLAEQAPREVGEISGGGGSGRHVTCEEIGERLCRPRRSMSSPASP